MAAPTRVSYTEVAYNLAGGSRASASVSWETGDVVVVIAATEGATAALPAVTNVTGLTFTTQKSNVAASSCAGLLSAAVASNTSSSVITCTNSDTSEKWGFSVWVYRGSAGIGNSVEGHTTAKTVALTPTAANSAIVWGGFDYGANAVTNNDITPTPTTENERAAVAGAYTVYVADLTDQTSAGATSYGVSGAGTIDAFTKLVLEIKGTAGATAVLSGTITSATTEANIVAGGKTIILTLTGDVWLVAAGGLFDAQRQNIINGIDSAQAEATGWDAEVKAKIPVTDVVRTSDTVVTITLSAQAAYNITATETITATVPASALLLGASAVATPTFTVITVVSSRTDRFFFGA